MMWCALGPGEWAERAVGVSDEYNDMALACCLLSAELCDSYDGSKRQSCFDLLFD